LGERQLDKLEVTGSSPVTPISSSCAELTVSVATRSNGSLAAVGSQGRKPVRAFRRIPLDFVLELFVGGPPFALVVLDDLDAGEHGYCE
jgi:hypothetical protein